MNSSNSDRNSNGLLYFLIGGGIGAAVALLFAPKSGSEIRSDITEVTKKGLDGTRDLAGRVKTQSQDLIHSIKGKADKVLDFAGSNVPSPGEVIDKTIENSDNLLETGDENNRPNGLAQSDAIPNRKSNAIF